MKFRCVIVLPLLIFYVRINNASAQLQVLEAGIPTRKKVSSSKLQSLEAGLQTRTKINQQNLGFWRRRVKSVRKITPHILYHSYNSTVKIPNTTLNINKKLKIHRKLKPRKRLRYHKRQKPHSDFKMRKSNLGDTVLSRISHPKNRIPRYQRVTKYNLNHSISNRKIIFNANNSYNNSIINNTMKYNLNVEAQNDTWDYTESLRNLPLHTFQDKEILPNSYVYIVTTVSSDISTAEKISKSKNINSSLKANSQQENPFSNIPELTTVFQNTTSNPITEVDVLTYSSGTITTTTTVRPGVRHTTLKMATILAVVTAMLLLPFLALWLSAVMAAARSKLNTYDDRELLL